MVHAYRNTKLSLTGLVYRYSHSPSGEFFCGYAKILNSAVLDKGDFAPPHHIQLSYKEDTHSYRTLVGFNYYPKEKRFEGDLEWLIRTRDVYSQGLHFETVRLKPEEMFLEERQFFTRILLSLEKLFPLLLACPRPLGLRARLELRKTTAGYPENFQHRFQKMISSGQAYALPRFSINLPPESWGQASSKRGRRSRWWERAPEFPAESSRISTGRYG